MFSSESPWTPIKGGTCLVRSVKAVLYNKQRATQHEDMMKKTTAPSTRQLKGFLQNKKLPDTHMNEKCNVRLPLPTWRCRTRKHLDRLNNQINPPSVWVHPDRFLDHPFSRQCHWRERRSDAEHRLHRNDNISPLQVIRPSAVVKREQKIGQRFLRNLWPIAKELIFISVGSKGSFLNCFGRVLFARSSLALNPHQALFAQVQPVLWRFFLGLVFALLALLKTNKDTSSSTQICWPALDLLTRQRVAEG